MTRLYLVRHATHGLVDKALAGRMPGVHLSGEGRAQAEAAARHFAAIEVAAILSSPMDRCRETAAPIAAVLGLPVATDNDLVELDCGEWTNKDFATLHQDPRWAAWNNERGQSATPGGESTRSVQARIVAAMTRLEAAGTGPTIFVSHSDVIKVAVQTLLGSPLDWHDRLQIDPASVTTVDLWPGGGKIVRLNEAVRP